MKSDKIRELLQQFSGTKDIQELKKIKEEILDVMSSFENQSISKNLKEWKYEYELYIFQQQENLWDQGAAYKLHSILELALSLEK